MTTTLDRVTAIRWDTEHAWRQYDAPAKYGALLGDWTTSTAADGHPLITATVHGQHAEIAVRRFADHHGLPFTQPGDLKPRAEYDDRGITASWRSGGVWVQLTAA